MVDASAIVGAFTALKAAKDIAEAMVSLRDTSAFQSKLLEFQSKLIDANKSIFEAQDERFALLERVGELEKELADFKAWEAEKQRYELKSIGSGATVYALKEDAEPTEPPHWLCANCYHDGKKRLLQPSASINQSGDVAFSCSGCSAKLMLPYGTGPGQL